MMVLKLRAFLLLAIAFSVLSGAAVVAQEIQATVTVNYDQLPIDKRDEITSMKNDLESYLNNTAFTPIEWEGERIPVDVTIYITGKSGDMYQARLFVVSKRVLDGPQAAQSITWRLYDDKWQFPYARNAVFTYQPQRFDPLVTLLDFYMQLVIGMDLDTYTELDGLPRYKAARELWQLGSTAGAPGYDMVSEPGDFTRYNLVTELTDLRYETFRRTLFAYYVDGMDQLAANRVQGLQKIDGLLSDVVRFKNSLGRRSVLLQAFFDAKHQELADIFSGYTAGGDVFSKLRYLDPAHTELYERAEQGKK